MPERELWKCRGYGKRGKPKTGFPLFPQPLGNLAKKQARFPHSHSSGDYAVEKWKTKSRFPTFPPRSPCLKTGGRRAGFALRPTQRRFAPAAAAAKSEQ